MSAPANHPSLRARIAQTLADLVAEHGGAKIGAVIGVCKSTPARRSIHEWSILDIAALAVEYPEIKQAVLALFLGEQKTVGEAIKCQRVLFDTIRESAELVAEASGDLADGRIDANEAKRLLPMVQHFRDTLNNELLPALEAFNGNK